MALHEPRGWQFITVMAIVAAVILGTTLCSIGILLQPLIDAFGATRAAIALATTSFVLAMAASVASIAIPLVVIFARLREHSSGPSSIRVHDERDWSAGQEVRIGDALRSRTFWLVAAAMVLAGLGLQSVYLYIVPFLNDADFPTGAAAVLWGATCSLATQLVPILLLDTVGSRSYGTLLGVSFLMSGVPMAADSTLAGLLHDTTGGHVMPMPMAPLSAVVTAAAAPLVFLRQRAT